MGKESLLFEIDQLRQDKIIYAVEACAINLVCLLVFMFSNEYLPSGLETTVNIGALLVGVGYTIFMGVGNLLRFQKITRLQDKIRK